MKRKILSFEQLKTKVQDFKQTGKRVVICYGVFGVLHIGHIRYLKKARNHGDILIVVLSSNDPGGTDRKENFDDLRAEALAHLDWVDFVTVKTSKSLKETIDILRPAVYAEGFESADYEKSINGQTEDNTFFERIGVDHVIVKEDDFSSTDQINRYLTNFSEDVINYMYSFRQRHSKEDVLRIFDEFKRLKVLVVGDTILDEYHYCETIGKSSKDPTLVLRYENKDIFAGGVLAVANHISSFAGQVDLVTVLGEDDRHNDYFHSHLKSNINRFFIYKPNAPTLIKRRFIDGYSTHKLFEVYIMDDAPLAEEQERALNERIHSLIRRNDIIVAADYGHGTLGKDTIKVLADSDVFLAVNTQSNAGNRGFNTISKYLRADYVSLAEHEIRLETRDLNGRLVPMATRISRDLSCRQFVITLGKKGSMVIDRDGTLIQTPSFTRNIVDRVGAGDAFFAMTSMASAVGLSSEIIGFLGNVAGSLSVQIMGNQKPIDRRSFIEYIDRLYLEPGYSITLS